MALPVSGWIPAGVATNSFTVAAPGSTLNTARSSVMRLFSAMGACVLSKCPDDEHTADAGNQNHGEDHLVAGCRLILCRLVHFFLC